MSQDLFWFQVAEETYAGSAQKVEAVQVSNMWAHERIQSNVTGTHASAHGRETFCLWTLSIQNWLVEYYYLHIFGTVWLFKFVLHVNVLDDMSYPTS